jgi:hypothetical protein
MAIVNGYVSLSEVKAALRINDSADDDLLELSIEAASREIDGYCERVFYTTGATAVSRVYIPTDNFLTETDDLVSVTQLKTSSTGDTFDTTWNLSTDVQLEPLNGVTGGLVQPYTRLRAIGDYLFPVWDPRNVNAHEATVQVTGVYGWASVPKAIKQATLLLSLRQFKRYDSPLGVAGFGDIGVVRVGRFDPDVESLVSPYRKVRMA